MRITAKLSILTFLFVLTIGQSAKAQPNMTSMTPFANSLGAAISSNIVVTFDADMDAASFDEISFLVYGNVSGPHTGSFVYDGGSMTLTFNPDVDFKYGEIVNVIATRDIVSTGLVPLSQSYHWSFTAEVASTGIVTDRVSYTAGDAPHGLCAADFNNDGLADIAVANFLSDDASVYINNGSGGFNAQVTYVCGDGPRTVVAGDLNQDGDIDLVVCNGTDVTVSVLINNGDGTFAAQVTYTTGGGPHGVITADLDSDGYLDVATANYTTNDISVLINNGDGTFAPKVDYNVGSGPSWIHAADLDNDGHIDLITADRNSDELTVYYNVGDGIFSGVSTYDSENGPRSIFSADLNGNGHLDLAIGNEYSDDIVIRFNDGFGTFGSPTSYSTGDASYSVVATDLDDDIDFDLVACNLLTNDISIFYNNGSGSFSLITNFPTGIGPTAIIAADFNNDGTMEFATTDFFGDSLSILSNPSEVLLDIQPDPIYAAMARPFSPQCVHIYLGGEFESGHDINDINTATLLINSSLPTVQTEVLGSYPGFDGEVLDICVDMMSFVLGYGVLYNTSVQSFSVEGSMNDATPFSLNGYFTYKGHVGGDVNLDGNVNVLDLTYLINYIFRQGTAPVDPVEADINADGNSANVLDLNYMINFIFRQGPPPLHLH